MSDALALARRHVTEGRKIVARQHQIVIALERAGRSFSVSVDPQFPDRWREELYFSQLCQMLMKNRMRIYIGDQESFMLYEGKLTQRRQAREVRLVF